MDEDVRRELAALRNDIRELQEQMNKVLAWGRDTGQLVMKRGFTADGHMIALTAVTAAVARAFPDPSAELDRILARMSDIAAGFSGASERHGLEAKHPNETENAVAELRRKSQGELAVQLRSPGAAASSF